MEPHARRRLLQSTAVGFAAHFRQRHPMKNGLIRAAAIGLLITASASLLAAPAGPTAAGLWEKTGESGMPQAWFRIIECNGVYIGRIVKMFAKAGENPSEWRCTQCGGDQRNAPMLGLTLIKDMQRNGLTYEGGSILDPRDGSIYSAQMQLSRDSKQLTVRGYLGIPLLGQSEVWHRLPDNGAQPHPFAACPDPAAPGR
jgi:uncharacterized protein (DUF2147 family)